MLRAVGIYCRISVDHAGRREGVDAQEAWGRAYAAEHWPGLPVRVFADNAVSAANGAHRRNFEALRQAVRAGELAHLLAVEQSRLERREAAWFEFAAELDAAGIHELHTRRDGIVRVHDDVAGIKAVLAAGEARRLRARTRDALAVRAADGRPHGAEGFGYRKGRDAEGRTARVIVTEEAEAIRWAADAVLSGWSLARVGAELRARGLRGRHGGGFSPTSVRTLLLSPAIAGIRSHHGVLTRATWEPILAEETWRAVRAKLARPRVIQAVDGGTRKVGVAQRRAGRRYLLTGLAVCGECGSPLTGTMHHQRQGAKSRLICQKSRGGCAGLSIMLRATEDHVVGELFAALHRPAFRAALAADEHAARREAATSALARLEQRRDDLARMWGSGELTAGEWRTARGELEVQEGAARLELQSIPPPPTVVEGLREAWPDMTLDERREMLRLFIARVTVHRAKPGTKRFDSSRVSIQWVTR